MVLSETEFKETVKTFVELEQELEKGSKTMSGLRKKRGEMMGNILAFMKHHDIEQINLGEMHIKRTVTKTVEALKKESLVGELEKALGDPAQAQAVADSVFGNRQVTEKEVLKKAKAYKEKSSE
jgi:hypothetical protein